MTKFKYAEGTSAAEAKKSLNDKELDIMNNYESRMKARALSRIYLYDKRNWNGS